MLGRMVVLFSFIVYWTLMLIMLTGKIFVVTDKYKLYSITLKKK